GRPLALDNIGEQTTEEDRVDKARVHALPARRAMHMRGIAHQEQTAGAIGTRDPVMNAEARAPDHILHDVHAGGGSPSAYQGLEVRYRRLRGRILERGDDAQVLPALAGAGERGTATERAGLVSSQLLGFALCRYILKLPPAVAMTEEQIVKHLGPT